MRTPGARHRAACVSLPDQLKQYAFLALVLVGVFGGLTLMAVLKAPSPATMSFARALMAPPAIVIQAPTVTALPKLTADTTSTRGRLAGKHDGERTKARLGANGNATSSSSPRGASEHAKSGDARKPHHTKSHPAGGRHRAREHHHSHHTAPHRGGHHHGR